MDAKKDSGVCPGTLIDSWIENGDNLAAVASATCTHPSVSIVNTPGGSSVIGICSACSKTCIGDSEEDVEKQFGKVKMEETWRPPQASHQIVDAYKTYLFRRGTQTVKEIENIKPGQVIPIEDLDEDIKAVQRSISNFKKWGIAYDEEEAKLKGLTNMLKQLAGRVWPDPLKPSQTEQQQFETAIAKAKLAKIAAESLQFEKIKKQKENEAKQKSKAPPSTAGYFSPQFIKTLKSQMPLPEAPWKPPSNSAVPVAKELSVKVGVSTITQQFIMRVGMLSDCNVSIHQENNGRFMNSGISLQCGKCGSVRKIEDTIGLSNAQNLPTLVEAFCKQHKHEQKAASEAQPVGRFFREEE